MHWRFILIFGLALAVVACGDDDEQIQEKQPQEQVRRPPPPAAQATAEPEPEPEVEPEPMSDPLYTVQVGAFLNPDSAVGRRDRSANQGLPVWTVDQEVEGRLFHRVRVGAVSTRSGARRLGEILRESYGWRPLWVAPVASTESVPDGTVEATRDLMGGASGSTPF